jgi:hypothetical protein
MTTVQCRLCVADIPHGYDHNLEVAQSEHPATTIANELNNFTLLEQGGTKEDKDTTYKWPDCAAIVCILFLHFVMNAAALIAWLITLSSYHDRVVTCESKRWLAGSMSIVVLSALSNWAVALATARRIKSMIVEMVCWITGAIWWGLLIWMVTLSKVPVDDCNT